ncbi:hypothetical protein OG21DRAFT_1599609 [Imleria badia]|nr:hypothetical protein OG21DRAFT_1599609 [Imleria badia]
MDLAQLSSVIVNSPSLQRVRLEQLLRFFALAIPLKNNILLAQPSDFATAAPPLILPASVQFFLSSSSGIALDLIQASWDAFKHILWSPTAVHDFGSVLHVPPLMFDDQHGLQYGFTSRTVYPPDQTCTTPTCPRTLKGMRMMHAEQRQCVLYTLAHGALPVYSIHLSCEACQTNYHHNFKVYQGRRTYYGGIPDMLQVGEHRFVERQVVEMWLTLMDTWVSATSCARVYNQSLSQSKDPPATWLVGLKLASEHVWDAFLLYCLLEDALGHEELLIVPHTGTQHDRFMEAVQARNQRMRVEGQPEITHYCNRCTRWYYGSNGKVNQKTSAVVTDGICIGCPCCGQYKCQVPLSSTKDRFCHQHRQLEACCSIVDCPKAIIAGTLTCDDPEHQEIERVHHERGQSRFQLHDHLQRARNIHQPEGGSSSHGRSPALLTNFNDDDEVFFVDDHDPGTQQRQKKVKAKFTRSWTHNEQLAVAPCGIILGRDTMFGAEAISSIAFLKWIFHVESLKPDHIIFDNNCGLAHHVKMDPFFADIGLSVDVFHFKSKHSETDTFCQENCNPAAFPELLGDDGKGWFFNSSVAEQTNAWFGGYHAICREMLGDKYDFFLD